MPPFAIVTASDSRYFELAQDLIRSIRDKPQGREVPIFVMDAGLGAPELQWLRQNRANVVALTWPYSLDVAGPLKALVMRCRIPELIPGHQTYLWLDADTWVQDWAAVELCRRTAQERHWCMTAEVDRSFEMNEILQWSAQTCRRLFGNALARRILDKPLLNAGVFCARGDAPHWTIWRQRVESALVPTNAHFFLDQTALNLVAHVDGLDIAILPALCNWTCHRALPWTSRDGKKLLDPQPPHQPLGIVHMTYVTKQWKFVLRSIGRGPVLRSLRYGAPSETAVDPRNPAGAQIEMARADSLTHHHARAARVMREAVAQHPRHAGALAALGQFAARDGDLGTAASALRQAVSIESNDGAINAALGSVYLRQGRCDEAVDELRSALRLLPGTKEVEQHLAEALEMRTLPPGDYVSPGFTRVKPDAHFPHMTRGDPGRATSPRLGRPIPHNWYVDNRVPGVGFVTRDEAHLLFNVALRLKDRRALEVGSFLGFGTCHVALGGMRVDAVDPVLQDPSIMADVRDSLGSVGVLDACRLLPFSSPAAIEQLAMETGGKWSLIFIDADDSGDACTRNAEICERFAADDAIILLRNVESPSVAAALDLLSQRGWNAKFYRTAPFMGVAWRGGVLPVEHIPDAAWSSQIPSCLAARGAI